MGAGEKKIDINATLRKRFSGKKIFLKGTDNARRGDIPRIPGVTFQGGVVKR